MSKLGELREEEEIAQLELEKAAKEAQKIEMSIPDLLEEQRRDKEILLKEIVKKAEAEVEKRIEELSESLLSDTEERLSMLSGKEEALEKAATENLRDYILRSEREAR
jgi:DNA integrity scanning protein DisA with diadenylate cyclase activity